MKTYMLAILGTILVASALCAIETADVLPARYQVIIERSPFGQVQGPGAGDLAPNWLANYVLTGLIQSNSGNGAVQAIISTKDNSRWYFRAEGEAVDSGAIQEGFQQEGEAVAKWKRARLSSTQLSTYFVGATEHLEMRERAKAKAGTSFDLQKYNDSVLSFGSRHERSGISLSIL
jgi:hypothetical protein